MTFTMRLARLSFIGFVLISTMSRGQLPPPDVRAVDFKNFSYPWLHPNGWPDHLQWMSLGVEAQQVVLIEASAADRRRQTEASMGAMPVVLVDPWSKVLLAFG
jgi:hypothetical protein